MSEDRMMKMAYYDPLTSLPNRTLFNDRLKHVISNAAREKNNVGLVLIDMDHFKVINENLGHSAETKLSSWFPKGLRRLYAQAILLQGSGMMSSF